MGPDMQLESTVMRCNTMINTWRSITDRSFEEDCQIFSRSKILLKNDIFYLLKYGGYFETCEIGIRTPTLNR